MADHYQKLYQMLAVMTRHSEYAKLSSLDQNNIRLAQGDLTNRHSAFTQAQADREGSTLAEAERNLRLCVSQWAKLAFRLAASMDQSAKVGHEVTPSISPSYL